MTETKIPKIIHYCWFGNGQKSDLSNKCIESWKKILTDYEFMEWNESNIDIESNYYVKTAYDLKKYSFVADFARIYALYNYGGIYLDLDVEVLNKYDAFLNEDMFFSFEDSNHVSTATIGSKKNHFFLKELLDYYNSLETFSLKTNVELITQRLCRYGLVENNESQRVCNREILVLKNDYFSPLAFGDNQPNCTNNTISIHWFEGTWQDAKIQKKLKLIKLIKAIIGNKLYQHILRRAKGLDYSAIRIGVFNCNKNDVYQNDYYKHFPICVFDKGKTVENKEVIYYNNWLIFALKVLKNDIKCFIIDDSVDQKIIKLLGKLGIKTLLISDEKNTIIDKNSMKGLNNFE